jgi:ubiquinone/menaquinone biosynthesis C-methylase UbiE
MPPDTLQTTEEWRALARQDALYAVAAWPGKENGGWSKEEFYGVGASDWADFRDQWRHYWPELGGIAVDFGCGAGRITHAMAADFKRVVGVDVSPEMAVLAREASGQNVEVKIIDGIEIPLGDASVDGVFTSHVLQHLEDASAVRLALAEMARVLRPGGTIMAHLLLASTTPSVTGRMRSELLLRKARRARGKGQADWTCRVRQYTHEQARTLLGELGFEQVELREFPVRSNGDPHPFWLARRS